MTARLSLYQKAEQELYKLDHQVKAKFYDFSHLFRKNPWHTSLRLKPLKGDGRIFSARLDPSYRVLLTRTGIGAGGEESWLAIAVRHRRDVYEQLSVAVNRITGEIEFVDLSVVGESALRRAGIELTPAEPEAEPDETPADPAPAPATVDPVAERSAPLLAAYSADLLRELGVTEALVELALVVTTSDELDQLVQGAPLLTKDVLYGLAAGIPLDDVRREITAPVELEERPNPEDFDAALARTTVTVVTTDEALRAAIEEGDFRAWKVFLHPTQARLVNRAYSGPARVSGGPGTGKTVVALHRVAHLAQQLPPGENKPILLTTFTKNLTTDLRARLASLLKPEQLSRVEVAHIDQLTARVLAENSLAGRSRNRVENPVALRELRDLLLELDERAWEPEFLLEEWEQVVLGQAVPTRTAYLQARRAGRGRPLNRSERTAVWKLLDQYTARLDKLNLETWSQAAERAARFEIDRAAKICARADYKEQIGAQDLIHRDAESGMRLLRHRYRHIVVDEAQDLGPAHWKMLRAMVAAGPDDLFIAGDTHQRIYDNQVSLGAVGINIRGRSSRLTLSYRTTKEILNKAITVVTGREVEFDDLDDGKDNLVGFRSVLSGPDPVLAGYPTWAEELAGLAETIRTWRTELTTDETGRTTRDARGLIAVCVTDRNKVNEVMYFLTTTAGITCAELTKDGARGDGEVHVGTMHRFKGLEYQRLAIAAAGEGILPRAFIEQYRKTDHARYQRELRKARSLLFVATTRARDSLSISWHGTPSRFLPR
ncbi:UvrD-helicase domain-containing protein [Kitasatospora purpeofusca]|uniref:UvrD-helicase domain-containing protein n=1 Tax=Kitasatospora purpeofusca TaxID=67352 RepID=UPI002A59E87F|nr:UvrD-helicase domain-containing protein [Kitasatospora purpeofusca]MDY0812390.1 UvrD-helicase domain-containing protein [Kitasatospora purpeofusca]